MCCLGIQEYHFNNKIKRPKFMFFIMRTVLKLKNNPKKIKELLKLTDLKENMKVMDYGCGIGSYSIEAGKIVGKSSIVIAADIDKKMILELKMRMKSGGLLLFIPLSSLGLHYP